MAFEEINFLEDSLAYAIKQAQVRCYEILFRTYGPDVLSPARMTALCIIGMQQGINQSALAELLRINRASVVKVIDTLESLGYVERLPTAQDRRSYALTVTDAGLDELKKLTQVTREYEKIVAAGLTAKERKTLMALLAKTAVSGAGVD